MRRKILAAVLTALLAGSAHAIMIKLDTPTLVRESDDVLMGRVTAMESQWDDTEQYIYTYVTVAVDMNMKSIVSGPLITIKVPGGEANGMTLIVSDTPHFEVGQEVVVFVTEDETGSYEVFGAAQGKYTVLAGKVLEMEMPLDHFLSEIRASISEISDK